MSDRTLKQSETRSGCSTNGNHSAKPKRTRKIQNVFWRHWFILLPAIAINAGLTFDHLIAKSNQEAFRVSLTATAVAEPSQDQDEPINQTLDAHWVTLNDRGGLEGRVSAIEPSQSIAVPISKLSVTLLQKGKKVRTSATDANGKFELKDVGAGVYTLVAAGKNGFLAYGLNVLPKLKEFDILQQNTQNESGSKNAYYVAHYGLPPNAIVQDELQIDAAAVPPEFSTLQRISQNYLPAKIAVSVEQDTVDLKAIKRAREVSSSFRFPLSDDGTFHGRIQPIATEDGEQAKLSEMNVFLIQDDFEVARVAVDDNGAFQIENFEPGVYSVVAAGENGFAALSLELIAGGGDDSNVQLPNRSVYVSLVGRRAQELGIAFASHPGDLDFIRQEINRISNPGPGGDEIIVSNQYRAPIEFQQDNVGFGDGFPAGGFSDGGFAFPGSEFPNADFGPGTGLPSGTAGVGPGAGGGGKIGGLLVAGLLIGFTADALSDDSSGFNPPFASPVFP